MRHTGGLGAPGHRGRGLLPSWGHRSSFRFADNGRTEPVLHHRLEAALAVSLSTCQPPANFGGYKCLSIYRSLWATSRYRSRLPLNPDNLSKRSRHRHGRFGRNSAISGTAGPGPLFVEYGSGVAPVGMGTQTAATGRASTCSGWARRGDPLGSLTRKGAGVARERMTGIERSSIV